MTPDHELLRRYAQTRSEQAFTELVRRHVNLVHSAALRQVGGDAHLAQDVAQTVFTDLARKAGSLVSRPSLIGWLYTSTHFAAAKMARTENRRRDREEKFMREPVNESRSGASAARNPAETDWEKIRPALDDVMHELNESDREAILLRFFENRHFAEIGLKLRLNENAARMRVERALEKLRAIFAKRGITTAAVLASVISANAVQTAPAGLAATVATTSVAAVGTGTTFTLLKFMTATHIKLGLSALVVAAAATAMVVQHQAQTRLREENKSLRHQLTQLQTDNQSLSNRLTSVGQSMSLTADQLDELLRLRGEVGILRLQTNELARLRETITNLMQKQSSQENPSLQERQRQIAMYKLGDSHTAGVALAMFAADNNDQFPTNFDEVARYLDGTTNLAQVFSNEFEIVYQGTLTNIANPSSAIVLQERQAWPTYGGKWAKVYGFADGHSEVHIEPYDNFSAYEKQHTVVPLLNQ